MLAKLNFLIPARSIKISGNSCLMRSRDGVSKDYFTNSTNIYQILCAWHSFEHWGKNNKKKNLCLHRDYNLVRNISLNLFDVWIKDDHKFEQLFLAKLLIVMAIRDLEVLNSETMGINREPRWGVSLSHSKLMQISKLERTFFFFQEEKNI